MLVPFVAFCYVPILLNASCHNGLQIVILDPGWSLERDVLSRNILGQDARSRVLRPCSQAFQPSCSCLSWGRRALPGCSNGTSRHVAALQKVDAIC